MCVFQLGLYALGLHNRVSPNWLSRTYSSHVSWINGQAMEIGASAINFLMATWQGHLTPSEAASMADKASKSRDPPMVRAAADLALSVLPQAAALNPNEIQRAIQQCREQSHAMLEKACNAVERASAHGSVDPAVMFEVGRHWYYLYEKTLPRSRHSQGNHGSHGQRLNIGQNYRANAAAQGGVETGNNHQPDIQEGRFVNQNQLPSIPAAAAAKSGYDLFGRHCVSCHVINGVYESAADGNANLTSGYAPNLTHLMTRTSFAGAIFELYEEDGSVNIADLKEWIRNAPGQKPSRPENRQGMISFAETLSDKELDDLVTYLMTLGGPPPLMPS